jgi:hypothetical protein
MVGPLCQVPLFVQVLVPIAKLQPCMLQTKRVDKIIRKYPSNASLDEIKADEYRYWQSRSLQERMEAVTELTQAFYAMKGGPDAPRLQRTLVRFERPQR